MLSRLTLLFLLAATSRLLAAQAELGDVSVTLPQPPGFCELAKANPADDRMLTLIGGLLTQSGNKLLSMSADCAQLKSWRGGKRPLLDDYAQYQVSLAMMDKAPSEPIEQTCATLRQQGNQIVSDEMPDLKTRIESAIKDLQMKQTTFIGVLAEEPSACYAGLVQLLHTQAGTDKTQLTLFAVTTVKNRTLYVYRFMIHTGSESVLRGLAEIKKDVAGLLAAN